MSLPRCHSKFFDWSENTWNPLPIPPDFVRRVHCIAEPPVFVQAQQRAIVFPCPGGPEKGIPGRKHNRQSEQTQYRFCAKIRQRNVVHTQIRGSGFSRMNKNSPMCFVHQSRTGFDGPQWVIKVQTYWSCLVLVSHKYSRTRFSMRNNMNIPLQNAVYCARSSRPLNKLDEKVRQTRRCQELDVRTKMLPNRIHYSCWAPRKVEKPRRLTHSEGFCLLLTSFRLTRSLLRLLFGLCWARPPGWLKFHANICLQYFAIPMRIVKEGRLQLRNAAPFWGRGCSRHVGDYRIRPAPRSHVSCASRDRSEHMRIFRNHRW